MSAPRHPHESDRLAYLNRIDILDTETEQIYDDFVKLAAAIAQAPVAMLSLVDKDRQWFKSSIGIDFDSTDRDISFCTHTILQDDPMQVSDATKDPRFANSPLVTGNEKFHFYLGVPVLVEGLPMGSLCVIDHTPRTLEPHQISALETLARQLSACLDARLAQKRQEETAQRLQMAETTLQMAKNRFERLFHNMAVASYTTDHEGVIFEFNKQAEVLFGREAYDVMGKTDFELLLPEDERENAVSTLERVAQGESFHNQERRIVRPDGTKLWALFNVHPATGPHGEVTGGINVYIDIAARKQMEFELAEVNHQLTDLANTDGLTQVANRRFILERLNKLFATRPEDTSVILLDIDHFKAYNDSFGHPAGDEVLHKVGTMLKAACRESDHVGRYGGEEFIIVLARTNTARAFEVAERIRKTIESVSWPHRQVTASLGLATYDTTTPTPEKLISKADVRLYAAKSSGRNKVVGPLQSSQNTAA